MAQTYKIKICIFLLLKKSTEFFLKNFSTLKKEGSRIFGDFYQKNLFFLLNSQKIM
jgi:hypothetical protein